MKENISNLLVLKVYFSLVSKSQTNYVEHLLFNLLNTRHKIINRKLEWQEKTVIQANSYGETWTE